MQEHNTDAHYVEHEAMPAPTAAITLAKALSIWVELTGVEPGMKGSFTLGDWAVKDLHNTIQQALDLDPTEVTGKMILAYIVQDYFESRNFTVDEMLTSPDKVTSYLAKANTLAAYLRSDAVHGEATEFSQRVKEVLCHYDALTPPVEKILDATGNQGDRAVLAILRRDALNSVRKLQINQFLDGETEAPGSAPSYGKFVYQWDNINSMLAAMTSAPSGITVNMIRAVGNPFGVYFVFAIRNGGRLFTFTDKTWTPHPLAEGMWRRPDKILAARAECNWFPYDLAGLEFDEEGRAYIDFASGTSLVPYQNKATPIKAISALAPPQVIWISMMMELIVEKFWHQSHTESVLSYTGEMVKVATPLLEAAKRANLPLSLRSQNTLQVAPITLADVHSDNISAKDVGKLGDGSKRWLEDRYGHRVLLQTLDGVSNPGETLLVQYAPSRPKADPEIKDTGERAPVVETSSLALELVPTLVTESEVRRLISWPDDDKAMAKMARVHSLDPTAFGTKAQLEKDRKFLARHNYASQINAMAKAEFKQRSKEVQKWVHEHIASNLCNLGPLLMAKDTKVHTAHRGDFGSHGVNGVRYEDGLREFVLHHTVEDINKQGLYWYLGQGGLTYGRLPHQKSCLRCNFTGSPSSHLLQIAPETAQQLAYLCGVEVTGLPDVLQHWTQLQNYVGNSILDRIDPLHWVVKNPWSALGFRVGVFVSKRTFAALQKEAKQAPWSEPQSWVDESKDWTRGLLND